jgi:hypothetical protein
MNMSGYTPTPEQMAVLEKTRSYKEKENLVEMWELEALASVPVPPKVEEVPVSEVKPKEVEPVVEPPKVEEPPAPEVEPKPAEDQGVEFWKKQAETWKKRKGDADRALTPAQMEAAQLRKQQEDSIKGLEDRFSSLEKLIQGLANRPRAVELDPDDEVDANYPDISRKIKATASSLAETLRKENAEQLRLIDERTKKYEQDGEAGRREVYAQSHFAQLKGIHSDAEDFLSEKLGPALVEWVKTQPSELQDAIINPLSHTPQYVGYVITQFKNATKYTPPAAHKPSLGDLATRAISTTQVKPPDAEPDVFPPNVTEKDINAQMRNLNNLFKRDPEKLDKVLEELIAKWDRTLTKRNK